MLWQLRKNRLLWIVVYGSKVDRERGDDDKWARVAMVSHNRMIAITSCPHTGNCNWESTEI